MDMTGSQTIAASPDAVWAALMDADVLKDCIPGATSLEGSPEEGFAAVVTQKIGPVKATFKGEVTLSDIRPGEGCRIEGSGKAGPAGHASGAADVTLTPEGAGTRLDYTVDAKVGGKIAQLGSRVVDGVARKLADAFFDNFRERVEGPKADAPAPDEPAKAAGEQKGFVKRMFGG